VNLRPASYYASEVRPHLPAHAFEAVPSRLLWLALHWSLIAAALYALHEGWGGWFAVPIYSLVIGHSFAGCAFVAHETLHGVVVRHRGLRTLIGWIAFLPFTLSPRLWVAWHNKTHHGHTMDPAVDPDAFPTLHKYRKSRLLRAADRVSFARERPAGIIMLLWGLSGQTLQMWLSWSASLPRRDRVMITVETLAGFAFWGAVGHWLGGWGFLFGYVVPLMLGNVVVISYILTNHSLSPMTEVNDPLVNSLTVTVPSWMARVHLHFGLHVEHHLFPSMSSQYAPLVREQLLLRWPERYQSMPFLEAMLRLKRTPRLYGSATVLEDPRTGARAPTLQPGPTAAPVEPPAPPPPDADAAHALA
jgi:fatty acid desaturase